MSLAILICVFLAGLVVGIPVAVTLGLASMAYLLSAGLPLVSSLTGELERLLEDHGCGVTYTEGAAESLVTALIDLFDHRARLETMAANASALYQERFTAERIYSELCGYLEDLASGIPSSRRDAVSFSINRGT